MGCGCASFDLVRPNTGATDPIIGAPGLYARFVALEPNGGVVAIPTNTNCWPFFYREKAEAMMLERCPQGYVVDKEEEVFVGPSSYRRWHITFHGK
jgi:hypothetical protein